MEFRVNDTIVVIAPDDSYILEVKEKLYAVDEEGGYIEFDDKAWFIPFADMQLVCRKHRKYEGKGTMPKTDCETCKRIWFINLVRLVEE